MIFWKLKSAIFSFIMDYNCFSPINFKRKTKDCDIKIWGNIIKPTKILECCFLISVFFFQNCIDLVQNYNKSKCSGIILINS